MAVKCSRCGVKLGFMERIRGAILCNGCKEDDKKSQEEARARYPLIIRHVWQGTMPEDAAKRALETLSTQAKLSEKERRELDAQSFRGFVEEVLADDILTQAEEKKVLSIANILGVTRERLQREFRDLHFRLFVARVNDGRLPIISSPRVILKRGEKIHLEMPAQLLKEVAITEYRGGYQGFSFQIVKGIRYHVGGVRGRRVTVGTELREDDRGLIIATSQRTIFLGSRKTVEVPYSKLISLEVFEDGIRFHLSNRKNAPLFKTESGHPIAAVVNAAIQRLSVE